MKRIVAIGVLAIMVLVSFVGCASLETETSWKEETISQFFGFTIGDTPEEVNAKGLCTAPFEGKKVRGIWNEGRYEPLAQPFKCFNAANCVFMTLNNGENRLVKVCFKGEWTGDRESAEKELAALRDFVVKEFGAKLGQFKEQEDKYGKVYMWGGLGMLGHPTWVWLSLSKFGGKWVINLSLENNKAISYFLRNEKW